MRDLDLLGADEYAAEAVRDEELVEWAWRRTRSSRDQ